MTPDQAAELITVLKDIRQSLGYGHVILGILCLVIAITGAGLGHR